MGPLAAKQGDRIESMDNHTVQTSNGLVNSPCEFKGKLTGNLSRNVNIMGLPAATVGSVAFNVPKHVPVGGDFLNKPLPDQGSVQKGSSSVNINGSPAARHGDTALTCNDPPALPPGRVVVDSGTVRIGD